MTAFHIFGDTTQASELAKGIGQTCVEGDVLLVITCGGTFGAGLVQPTVFDNIDTDGAGWELEDDVLLGTDDNAYRATVWVKVCGGGEDTVTCHIGSAADISMCGVRCTSLSFPQPYVIDHGPMPFVSTQDEFESANLPRGDGESYVALVAASRKTITYYTLSPDFTDAQAYIRNGAVWTGTNVTNAEGSHTAADVLSAITGNGSHDDLEAYNIFFGFSDVIPAPENTVTPVVTGKAKVGQTLSCSSGTWTGDDVQYSYQWYQCVAGNPVSISMATAATYVVQPGDTGLGLLCRVTGSNDGGDATAQSAKTANVRAAASGLPIYVLRRHDGQ